MMSADDPWRDRDDRPGTSQVPAGPPGCQAPPGYGPPPAYGSPGPYPAPVGGYAPQETSSRAVVVLVCAIASFVLLPLIPAVAALVLSGGALREIAVSDGRVTGAGLVRAGRIVAWVNIALSVLVVVVGAVLAAVVVVHS